MIRFIALNKFYNEKSIKYMKPLFVVISLFIIESFSAKSISLDGATADSIINHQTKNSNISISGMKGLKTYTMENLPDNFGSKAWRDINTPFTGPMGHYLPKEFGESKYDKDISVAELMQTGDLDKLRDRERTAEVTKVLSYIASFTLIGFIILLVIRLKNK